MLSTAEHDTLVKVHKSWATAPDDDIVYAKDVIANACGIEPTGMLGMPCADFLYLYNQNKSVYGEFFVSNIASTQYLIETCTSH